MTNDTVVPTKELEHHVEMAKTECLAPRGCGHCEAMYEIGLHAPALAAEVLAGRKRDMATRKALEAARDALCHYCRKGDPFNEAGLHVTEVRLAKAPDNPASYTSPCRAAAERTALAALEVPDGE